MRLSRSIYERCGGVENLVHLKVSGASCGKATAAFARGTGYQKPVVQVRGTNAPAEPFYRRLRFAECGRLSRQVNGLLSGGNQSGFLARLTDYTGEPRPASRRLRGRLPGGSDGRVRGAPRAVCSSSEGVPSSSCCEPHSGRITCMLRFALLCVLSILGPSVAEAGEQDGKHSAVRTVQVVRTSSSVTVDGRLDDEVWLSAPAATNFIQRDPDEGKPATEQTDLRLAYDEAALYVGVRLHDRDPARISRHLSRRDQQAEADSFSLLLDPHHDHLTGAIFRVTAAGVQADAVLFNDSWDDDSWDAVWESAVSVDEGGWTVEMRIPFSQLRFPAAEQHTFGINAMRLIHRKNEEAWLVYVPKTESGLASRMGHLTGFEELAPHRTVEFLPYAVGRAEFVAPSSRADPFNDGGQVFGGIGLDVKYRVSSSLTLDGTVNPDFGQVEVDPAVVNLTAFETFFQERRPFFIEGANLFGNFGRGGANNFWGFNRAEPLIFYSRRIGRSPQGEASGDFVERPTATTILGAAKLTGRTSRGWSVGLLEAVTGREWARTSTDGLRGSTEVEPLSNYFVGRVQRDLGQRAAVGLLATAVNRDLESPALRDLLPGQAYVAGADAHYFLDSKRDWVVTGRAAASYVSGSAPSISRLQRAPQRYYQRPDAPHVELDPAATSLGGWTGSVNLNRNSGMHLMNAALWGVSPGFDSSDAGFTFNADRAGMHVVYSWNNPNVSRIARRRFVAVAKWYTWNFARELQGNGLHVFGNIQFKNYWTISVGGFASAAIQDDRATRGGPSMVRPAYWGGFFGMESDSRKRLSIDANGELAAGEDGGSTGDLGVRLRYRPATSFDVSMGPSFSRRQLPAQYVGTFVDPAALATSGSRYVFANLDQKEFTLETRINYLLSPKMSLQVFMQPLVSVGDYENFKQLAQPRTYDFIRFGHDRGMLAYHPSTRQYAVSPGDGGNPFTFRDPDFNFKSLRLNAIFRWEFRPGSTLYIVWTEQREDTAHPGQFVFGRDLGGVFRAPADDVLLVKIAYWFNR